MTMTRKAKLSSSVTIKKMSPSAASESTDTTSPTGVIEQLDGSQAVSSTSVARGAVDNRRVTVRRKADRRDGFFENTQRRAYEIYQARGSAPGRALDDWLQAESEVRAEATASTLPTQLSKGTHLE